MIANHFYLFVDIQGKINEQIMTTISPVFFCIIIENFQKEKIIGSIREKNSHVFIFFWLKCYLFESIDKNLVNITTIIIINRRSKSEIVDFFDILPFMKCFIVVVAFVTQHYLKYLEDIDIYFMMRYT